MSLDIFSQEAAALVNTRMVQSVHHVPTGIRSFDKACRLWGDQKGIPRGSYVVLAGKSGAGKTRLALSWMRQAMQAGEWTAFESYEMPQADIAAMAMQSVSRIPYNSWLPSSWSDGFKLKLLEEAANAQDKYHASVFANSMLDQGKNLSDLMEQLDKDLQLGCSFFVVDHCQLVKVPRVSNVVEKSEIVSETVREWTVDNRVTTVMLSQINRESAKRFDVSPDTTSIWGGTSMEANATQVYMLDHARYERDDVKHYIARTYVGLLKNRLGPDGFWVPTEVDYSTVTYREMMPDEQYNWPDYKVKNK